jgi:hypothetical protein
MRILQALPLYTQPIGHPVIKYGQFYLGLSSEKLFQTQEGGFEGALNYTVRVGKLPGQLAAFYCPPLGNDISESDLAAVITDYIKLDGVLVLDDKSMDVYGIGPDDVPGILRDSLSSLVFIAKELAGAVSVQDAYTSSNSILYLPWSGGGPTYRKVVIDEDSNLVMGSVLDNNSISQKKDWVLSGKSTHT